VIQKTKTGKTICNNVNMRKTICNANNQQNTHSNTAKKHRIPVKEETSTGIIGGTAIAIG
jgi:hypothetical protein